MILSFISLRFIRDKKFNLHDPITSFLPASVSEMVIYKGVDYTKELTVSHLITQTSALPCYLIDKRPDGRKNMDLMKNGDKQSWPLDKVISVVKHMQPGYRPGSAGKANYSETNFRLLGKILETVSGLPLQTLLSNLFAELQMDQTFVLPRPDSPCAPVFFRQNQIDISDYWVSTGHDIASTADDQMKFLRSFFDGTSFSSQEINDLKTWNPIFFPFKYGMGIQKFYIPRILSPFQKFPETIGHCGSVGSVAFYIPEKELYVTGTVNQTSAPGLAFRTMVSIINQF